MDTLVSPLVLTKLHLPAKRPQIIPRNHLYTLLAPESGKGFILVSAPAGYGKTTLLVEWAHSIQKDKTAVAWYALDPSDDDPASFGTYLVASLTHAIGQTPDLTYIAQILRTSPGIDLQKILQSTINAIVVSERACVLILDDYHLITSPAIHSGIKYLLEHLPQNMRIVIGSRSDPPLALARMRARGHLLEIRTANLRFTADETGLFLNEVMKLDLKQEGIELLEMRTEGWVAGLQLAALSLSGRSDKEGFITSFTGSHRFLVEYLMEEVFNRQSEEVQFFLLSTSILERMCAPLCDAILGGRYDSGAILNRLDQANLFVKALDDQGTWFRYHHLFRDFLSARLQKKEPEREFFLHRAACEWLAEHDFLREAAQQAFQASDWEYAAGFVEQHCFTMIIHSEISMMYEWCLTFPEEVMQAHPLLCILQCWGLVMSFRRQNRSRIEERLGQVEQVIAVMEDRQQADELREHATVVRTFLSMAPDPNADSRKQLALGQRMLDAYPEGNAGRFSALITISYAHMALGEVREAIEVLKTGRQIALNAGLYFGIVESTFHLARLAHSQGRLKDAVGLCRQGMEDIAAKLGHPEQELPALGCLDIALGCVLLEQDHLEETEEHLLHGLDLIGVGMNPYYLLIAYTALARLYEIQERSGEALMYLNRLEEAWPDIAFCTRALRVMFGLRAMPEKPAVLKEARDWRQSNSTYIHDSNRMPGMGPFGAAEAFYIAHLTWIRAQIASGNVQAARIILEQNLNLAITNDLTNRVIELSLLEALAGESESDTQTTQKALERALMAGQPEDYIRIFDQGPALTRLLIKAGEDGICRDYIERILAIIGSQKKAASNHQGVMSCISQESERDNITSLSERELDVLRLMAQGATNQTIAETLVITVGTVKSHINHILGKLDSKNRTEAVAQGRRLGFI